MAADIFLDRGLRSRIQAPEIACSGVAFVLLTRRRPREHWVPAVALLAPALCALIDAQQARWFGACRIGLELLLTNAAITFAGLWLASLGRRPPGEGRVTLSPAP